MLEPIKKALEILGPKYQGEDAIRMILAIGFQESGMVHQHQIGGPAHGLYQFEKYGGVIGVMTHPSTKADVKCICDHFNIPFKLNDIFEELDEENDVLDAALARLLLWTDPNPLPNEKEEAWQCYLRTWRPGKPHRNRWDESWNKANQILNKNMKELYVIKTDSQVEFPEYVVPICEHDSEGWNKTFCELTEEQAIELTGQGIVVEFIGSRPNDR